MSGRAQQDAAGLFGTEEDPVVLTRERAGEGLRPLRVLLLHGLASSPRVWDPVVPLLDAGCEVWAAGLPWRGAGVAGWSEQPPAVWMDEVMDRMPGGVPEVIVAHSFAANATLAWLDQQEHGPGAARSSAARTPRGVVLAAPFYRAAPGEFDWEAISYYLNHFDRILQDGVRVRSKGSLTHDIEHSMALKVRERVGCYGWMRFFDSYLGTPALRTDRMRMPFAVISGREDFAAFPRDARALADALPDAAAHVLPDAGHFTMAELPQEFAALANTLIRSVSARNETGPDTRAMEYQP